jgi:hypothetical protein
MSAALTLAADSFHVVLKRHPVDGETVFAQFQHGMTIAEALGENATTTASVIMGGIPVPSSMWAKVRPRVGIPVEIIIFPQGGGNGAKFIRIVALVVLAYFTAGASSGMFATSGGMFAAGSASAMALSAGLMIVGTLAINALIPPPTPKGLGTGNGGDPFNQLASLTGTSNQAAPYGVIPCVVGSTRFMTLALPTLKHGDDVTIDGRRFWRPLPVPGQIPRDMAIHEAGHAIAAWWCGQGIARVHVGADGAFTENGGSYLEGTDETAVRAFCKALTRKQLNDRVLRELVFAMAGPMAEARLKGYGLAWQALAMDPGYRQWQEGDPPSDLHCWTAASLLPKPKDRQRVANGSITIAGVVLAFYWPQVEALADALQERRSLTGGDVLDVIGQVLRPRLSPLLLGSMEAAQS